MMDTDSAITEATKEMGIAELKEKQKEAISTLLQGRDTFVALPTSYGKLLIYALLPPVFDKLKGMP